MKTTRAKRTLFVLFALYFNSVIYGLLCCFSAIDNDIWSLSHYVLLAFFYISFAIDYENGIIKRKALSLLVIPLALVIMFSGYIISESIMPYCIILLTIQGISFVSIIVVLFISKRERSIKKQIKQQKYISVESINPKKLFLSMLFLSLSFFVSIGLTIVSSLACHANLSTNTLFGTFCVLLSSCIVLNFNKNYFFWSSRKKLFIVISLVENFWFLTFSVIYYYLNAVVYYGTREYIFYVYIIPVISLIPFFVISKKISQQYRLSHPK